MILTSILLGASLLIGGTLLARFWNQLVSWLKRAVQQVSQMINDAVYGTKVFISRMGSRIKEISKNYSKDRSGRWKETIATKEVDASQVPPEILRKAKIQGETDITRDVEMELVY